MGRVPEAERKNRGGQVAALLKKLAGHKIFGRLRGTLGVSVIDCLLAIVQTAGSPTAAVRQWDEFAADIRVLIQMLATLKRDGQDYAGEEMSKALGYSGFMFTGETVPVGQTIPLVVYVPGAKQTLTMLQWIITDHWSDLNNMLDILDGVQRPCLSVSVLTRQLFRAFPSLEAFARNRRTRGNYEGCDLIQAHYKDVVNRFSAKSAGAMPMRLVPNFQYNDHFEFEPLPAFAYLEEGDQSEILARYSREDQADVATWQLHVPAHIWRQHMDHESILEVVVELYPKTNHGKHRRSTPALVSKSVNHGFGARFVIQDRRHVGGDKGNGVFSVGLQAYRRR